MKKLFLLLFVSISFANMTQAQKLGTNGDPIRQMLFANQSLDELVKRAKLDGTDTPFQKIADASKLADEGKKNDAIAKLKTVLQATPLEARIELWTWTGLRELGEKPDAKIATEVLGVILEVPMNDGYDTLGAYADGSARYLNFSGKAIFWDKPDVTISNLCKGFIQSAIPASAGGKIRSSNNLPKAGVQITLLTRSGNYVIVSPPQFVMNFGGKLMMELINRTNEKKN